MRLLRLRSFAALAAGLLLSGSAAATTVAQPFTAGIDLGGQIVNPGDLSISYTPMPNGGAYTLDGPFVGANGTIESWGSVYDVDPFVTLNFVVTNTTAFTQTYVFTVTSPVVPQTPATQMSGSIGLTLTNTDSASATLADNGNAVYTARIDGAPVQTLLSPAYSLSCTPAFCSTTDSASFGIPVPIIGPGALSSIGITVQFTLTPGDSAGVTSVFNIIAVPEPGTAILMAIGVVGLSLAGRRQS